MILARALSTAVASPARQGGDATASNTQSDQAETPFDGVLDQLAGGGDRRGAARRPDGAATSDGQARKAPTNPAGAVTDLAAVPPALAISAQAEGYVLPSPAAASPKATGALGTTGSVDLASFLAALAPAAEAVAKPAAEVATSANHAKGAGKTVSDAAHDAASASAGRSDGLSLSDLLGLAPLGLAGGDLNSAGKDAGKDPPDSGGADLRAAAAALSDRDAGPPLAAGGAAALHPAAGEAFAASSAPILKSVSVETQLAPALPRAPAPQGALAPKLAGIPADPNARQASSSSASGAAIPGAAASRARATGKDDASDPLAPVLKAAGIDPQLAPALPPSPTQQVVATVQKLAAATGSPTQPEVTQAAPVPSRTLTLVLEPQALGAVTVRLQLRGGSLDLQLDVDNVQTLGLLARDKDTLTAAIATQDYQVGTLTLRASDAQTSSQGSDHGSRPQDQSAGSQSGDAFPQGQGSQDGGGLAGGSRQNTRPARSQPADEGALARGGGAAGVAGAGGVYI